MANEVWELAGTVDQLLYSPRGDYEGLLIDVEGIRVQFVLPAESGLDLASLEPGAPVTLWGTVREASDKGASEHEVYEMTDIRPALKPRAGLITGRVERFNYAKHGERNGVILDTGDFIHTKPEGLKKRRWKLGQTVSVRGSGKRLADGRGMLIDV